MQQIPEITRVDAWMVEGHLYVAKKQAFEAQQAHRFDKFLVETLQIPNLNEQEKTSIGWMILNRRKELKDLIETYEKDLLTDKDFAQFVADLEERAEAIEKAKLDQEEETDEAKEKVMKAIKDARMGIGGTPKTPGNRKKRRGKK